MEHVASLETLLRKCDFVTSYNPLFIDMMKRGSFNLSGYLSLADFSCNDIVVGGSNLTDSFSFPQKKLFLTPDQPISKQSWSRQTHHLFARKIRRLIEQVFMAFYMSYGKDVCHLIAKEVAVLEFDSCQPQNIAPLPMSLCNVVSIIDMLEKCVKCLAIDEMFGTSERDVNKPYSVQTVASSDVLNSYKLMSFTFQTFSIYDKPLNFSINLLAIDIFDLVNGKFQKLQKKSVKIVLVKDDVNFYFFVRNFCFNFSMSS